MEYYFIDLFSSFSCLAGACPDTCCLGWDILVSGKDYERFLEMEPVWLRENILGHIQKKGQEYYFKRNKDGDCMMLEEDGLCRIQRNTSEEMLCNTCRKYPRIYWKNEECMYFSMAASCPVVSRLLLNDMPSFYKQAEEGNRTKLSIHKLPFCAEVLSFAEQMHRERNRNLQHTEKVRFVPAYFEKLADILLDFILAEHVPKRDEILELLSYYETDMEEQADFEIFHQETWERWQQVAESYFKYRIYSRYLECPEESAGDNYIQVCGELSVFYLFIFLKRMSVPRLLEEDWREMLGLMYRFAVHGVKRTEKLHKAFRVFFHNIYQWDFMIFDNHF